MTWALAAQLASAFLGGAWWMYRRQRRQIRLIAAENRRLHCANADLADDLFDQILHDDPDDDLQDAILDAEFYGRMDAAVDQSRPDHTYRAWMN